MQNSQWENTISRANSSYLQEIAQIIISTFKWKSTQKCIGGWRIVEDTFHCFINFRRFSDNFLQFHGFLLHLLWFLNSSLISSTNFHIWFSTCRVFTSLSYTFTTDITLRNDRDLKESCPTNVLKLCLIQW